MKQVWDQDLQIAEVPPRNDVDVSAMELGEEAYYIYYLVFKIINISSILFRDFSAPEKSIHNVDAFSTKFFEMHQDSMS